MVILQRKRNSRPNSSPLHQVPKLRKHWRLRNRKKCNGAGSRSPKPEVGLRSWRLEFRGRFDGCCGLRLCAQDPDGGGTGSRSGIVLQTRGASGHEPRLRTSHPPEPDRSVPSRPRPVPARFGRVTEPNSRSAPRRDDYDKKVKQAKEKARRRHTPAPTRPRKPDLQVYLPRHRGKQQPARGPAPWGSPTPWASPFSLCQGPRPPCHSPRRSHCLSTLRSPLQGS